MYIIIILSIRFISIIMLYRYVYGGDFAVPPNSATTIIRYNIIIIIWRVSSSSCSEEQSDFQTKIRVNGVVVFFQKSSLLARATDNNHNRPGSRYLYVPAYTTRVNGVLTINTRIKLLYYILYTCACGLVWCAYTTRRRRSAAYPSHRLPSFQWRCSPCRVRNQLEVDSAQIGVTRATGWTNSGPLSGWMQVMCVCVYVRLSREKKSKVRQKRMRNVRYI